MMYSENGELFIDEEFSRKIEESMKINDFNKTMINGIKLREGYDTIDDVLSVLVREHMERVGAVKDPNPFEAMKTFNISYSTQATDEEEGL